MPSDQDPTVTKGSVQYSSPNVMQRQSVLVFTDQPNDTPQYSSLSIENYFPLFFCILSRWDRVKLFITWFCLTFIGVCGGDNSCSLNTWIMAQGKKLLFQPFCPRCRQSQRVERYPKMSDRPGTVPTETMLSVCTYTHTMYSIHTHKTHTRVHMHAIEHTHVINSFIHTQTHK